MKNTKEPQLKIISSSSRHQPPRLKVVKDGYVGNILLEQGDVLTSIPETLDDRLKKIMLGVDHETQFVFNVDGINRTCLKKAKAASCKPKLTHSDIDRMTGNSDRPEKKY